MMIKSRCLWSRFSFNYIKYVHTHTLTLSLSHTLTLCEWTRGSEWVSMVFSPPNVVPRDCKVAQQRFVGSDKLIKRNSKWGRQVKPITRILYVFVMWWCKKRYSTRNPKRNFVFCCCSSFVRLISINPIFFQLTTFSSHSNCGSHSQQCVVP